MVTYWIGNSETGVDGGVKTHWSGKVFIMSCVLFKKDVLIS